MPAPESLGRDLTRILRDAQAESRVPSLAGAVAQGGTIVWSDAVGLADVEAGTDATPEHAYRIGSITKTFTATLIMQLRDEGKLDLDAPADTYVEGARHAPTLRRMLSHLSGLQREPTSVDWEAMNFGPDNIPDAIAEAELILPGGAHWHYSNLAFAFLGEVVARVSGKPWAEALQERLLQPVGLTRTTLEASEPAAKGYLVQPYTDTATVEWSGGTSIWAPAGQLWSTVSDLTKWGAFLVDPHPDVLKPETAEEMRTFQAMADRERWKLGWGLGLMLVRDGDRILAGHGGAMPGFLSFFGASAEQKVVAAVVTNSSGGVEIDEILVALAKKALDELPAEAETWRPGEPPPPELEGVLGRWWSEGTEFVFRWRGGRLESIVDGQPSWKPPAVFEREDADRYRVTSGMERGELLRIVRDERGAVTKLYWASYPFNRESRPFHRPDA